MAKGSYGKFRDAGNGSYIDADFGAASTHAATAAAAAGSDSGSTTAAAAADTGTDTDSSDAGAASGFTDPNTVFGIDAGTGADTGSAPKRRGRPPGTGKKIGRPATKTTKVQTSLDGIEGILLSLHVMGAAILGIPELALSEDEAGKLSDSIARVASLYDLGASEKTLAWVNLAVCCGGLYGTRMFAYNMRVKLEAEKKRKEKVSQFPTFQAQP